MRMNSIRIAALFLAVIALPLLAFSVTAESVIKAPAGDYINGYPAGVAEGSLKLPCKSAILMESETGRILYAQNAEQALPPASVTKIMTLLLVMEAIDAGTVRMDSTVTVSANAASMGGSQVFLKEGEQMKLEELLKSVVIASANDAAVALAEYLCGNVSTFVEKMNEKAEKLGMHSTFFENVTGLDDTAEHHLTSAKDIAFMSRALITHKDILKYSSIWMDSIRDGTFELTNTNRLVRFYRGCTGLKTGSTQKAGFCVSATAERDGLSLICVIMGAESGEARNASASRLLDWGFSQYAFYRVSNTDLPRVKVIGGEKEACNVYHPDFCAVVKKSDLASITAKINLPETVNAPIKNDETVGSVDFCVNGRVFGSVPIVSSESIGRIDFFQILYRMAAKFLLI